MTTHLTQFKTTSNSIRHKGAQAHKARDMEKTK